MTYLKCKICGAVTNNDATKLCDNCWEIDRRIISLNQKAIKHFLFRLASKLAK